MKIARDRLFEDVDSPMFILIIIKQKLQSFKINWVDYLNVRVFAIKMIPSQQRVDGLARTS